MRKAKCPVHVAIGERISVAADCHIATVPLHDADSEMPALELCNVRKTYRGAGAPAVNGVTFKIARGEVVGLLGPNGAGKSTTIGLITTRIPVDTGEILVGGRSATRLPTQARAAMGVTGQSNTLDTSCTVRENLYLHCRYHGMSRVASRVRAAQLLDTFGLADKAMVKPPALSGGLARRLQLARAMSHEPRLLLLDEPTNELDALSQTLFWEQIDELRISDNTAVLFATHLLEEAEQHCDRVLIMDHGQLILDGRPDELRRTFRGAHTLTILLRKVVDRSAHTRLQALRNVVRCTINGRTITVLLDSGEVPLHDIAELVQPFGIEEVSTRKASLREIFLDVIDTTVRSL